MKTLCKCITYAMSNNDDIAYTIIAGHHPRCNDHENRGLSVFRLLIEGYIVIVVAISEEQALRLLTERTELPLEGAELIKLDSDKIVRLSIKTNIFEYRIPNMPQVLLR